jgi:hypothetical protein
MPREVGPQLVVTEFVRPPELRGAGGASWCVTPPAGLKRSLDGSGCLRSGKGPIVEKHTPSLERLRGGGGCRFVVMLASDHSAIVSRIAYLGRPPHFRRLVDVFHRIKKSLPPVENAVHTRTPPAGYQTTFNCPAKITSGQRT